MKIEILYEDEYFVCVSKPNNVLIHHANYSKNVSNELSLIELLYNQLDQKLYPLHRLDRKTSGILILVKDTKHVSKFQKLFYDNKIKKVYYGLVRGYTPNNLQIDTPVKGRDSNVYKEAETILETIESFELNIPVKPYKTSRYSLVRLTPKTGRLHQLRIHMNKISHPLIGDPKYGDNNHNIMFSDKLTISNLFLHAYSITFQHPFTSKEITLKAPFPKHWVKIFDEFNWHMF